METPLLFYRQGGKNLNIKYIPRQKARFLTLSLFWYIII